MISRFFSVFLLISLSLPVFFVGADEVFLPGEGDASWSVVNGRQRGGSFNLINTPAEARGEGHPNKAAQVQWAEDHERFLELHATPSVPIHAFAQGMHGKMSVQIYSPGNAVNDVSLRLQDSRGAVYQYRKPVDLSKAGWSEVIYQLAADSHNGVWNLQDGADNAPVAPMHLLGVALGLSEEGQRSGFLLFGPISVLGAQPPPASANETKPSEQGSILDAIDLRMIDPEGLPPVMTLSQARPIRLELHNRGSNPVRLRAEAVLRDFSGRTFSQDTSDNIAAGQRRTWVIGHTPDRASIWWIDITLSLSEGEEKQTRSLSLAVMEPTGSGEGFADGFLFGMCSHAERLKRPSQDAEARAMGLIGVDIARTSETWGSIQPSAEQWDWGDQDYLVETFWKQGVELQFLLGYTPKWATTGNPETENWLIWSRKAPRIEAWEEFCRKAAERYNERIRFYEIWNEPDLDFFRGTADEYLRMLRVGYDAIKGVNPDLTVMSGGFASSDRNPEFLHSVLSRGSEWYDVLAWHRHGTFSLFVNEVHGGFEMFRKRYASDKPVIFNESGTRLRSVTDEHAHAAVLVKRFTFAQSVGAKGYMWYKLRDYTPQGDTPGEDSWGLLESEFQPRAAFVAYNAMTAQLKGMTFDQQFSLGANRWLLGFKGVDKYVLVGWVENPTSPQSLTAFTDSHDAHRVDLMGHPEPLNTDVGFVQIQLTELPVYTVLNGVSAPPRIGRSIVSANGPLLVTPGGSSNLKILLHNPTDRDVGVTAKLNLPVGFRVEQPLHHVGIEAGGEQEWVVNISSNGASSEVDAGNSPVNISYDFEGVVQGRLEVPLHLAVAVPASPPEKPQFILNDRSQVTSLFDHDPNSTEWVWTGPSDLSADVSIWHDTEDLVLRLAVTDDLHTQPFENHELWKGDGVQVVLQSPEQTGVWRLSLAHTDSGEAVAWVDQSPQSIEAVGDSVRLTTKREEDELIYEARLRRSDFGLVDDARPVGFSFNLIINDKDQGDREGWIGIAPGIGNGVNTEKYPHFVITLNAAPESRESESP